MRQPCKTRPFFFCNVSLPLLPGPLRFIASLLIFISMTCLVFITQALDGNFFSTLFWLPCLQTCSFVLLSSCLQEFQWPSRSRYTSRLTPRRSRKRVQNYTFSPTWQNLFETFFKKILRNRCFLIKSTDLSGSTPQYIALNKNSISPKANLRANTYYKT